MTEGGSSGEEEEEEVVAGDGGEGDADAAEKEAEGDACTPSGSVTVEADERLGYGGGYVEYGDDESGKKVAEAELGDEQREDEGEDWGVDVDEEVAGDDPGDFPIGCGFHGIFRVSGQQCGQGLFG